MGKGGGEHMSQVSVSMGPALAGAAGSIALPSVPAENKVDEGALGKLPDNGPSTQQTPSMRLPCTGRLGRWTV